MAKITSRSEFFIVSGGTVEKLPGVTGIDPGASTASTTDIRTWDDATTQPVQTGLEVGEATVTLFADPDIELHRRLYDLSQETDSDAKQMTFVLGWSDGKSAPTVDAEGNLKLPEDRTFYRFDGWVSSFPLDFTGDAVQTEMTIQRQNKGTWSTKSEAA